MIRRHDKAGEALFWTSGSRKAAALARYGYKDRAGRAVERRKYCRSMGMGVRLANSKMSFLVPFPPGMA